MKKILALVVLGVAIKYFLDSEKGEEFKNEVRHWWDRVEDTLNDVVAKAFSKVETAAEKVDDITPH